MYRGGGRRGLYRGAAVYCTARDYSSRAVNSLFYYGSVVVVTEREEDRKGLGSRSGFDCGLRSSFFLLETFSKTGQTLRWL